MAFPLGEHRDEHVGARHLLAARRLDIDRGPLQHTLERGRRLRILDVIGDEVGKLVVDVVEEVAPQLVQIDAAGAQHGDRILVFREREQEMLQRRVFVPALVRKCGARCKVFSRLRESTRGSLVQQVKCSPKSQRSEAGAHSFSNVH